ncbi:MAG: TlpA disulfide reductase family protein [Humidesulfovibrio sp.]|uniref:peroxiredoxin family protein n=1 Tax=Humidesulfovibrio sp. TaxID=2910988 RepID=UPI00280033C3|nr:TlpA disulfide reductase family protein [Humidesulfovibrio sp.]MDQ7835724.1 TlpA disulfide reductase family protein [Humidesulfovibrio sp.]
MRASLKVSVFCALALLVFAGAALAATAQGDKLPAPGQTLPTLQLKVPVFGQDAKDLGVAGKKTFGLQDLKAKVIVLEVIGVYCSECAKQVGSFNTLYSRLSRRIQAGEVRLLGLAAGGNDMEVESLRKTGLYKYPVVADENYKNHKLLREPKTPFTMIVTPAGKVLYSHLGVDEDIEAMLARIKEALK